MVALLKILFFTALAIYSVGMYSTPHEWHFIQNVNLVFHEAGHVFLLPFGRFMHFLGGTLFEFGVPLVITVYFVLKRQYFAASFSAWWLSTAFFAISVYAADALMRQLPLLGGESVNHDWHTMLDMLDILKHYKAVANTWLGLSFIALAIAVYLLYVDLKPLPTHSRTTT